MGPMRATGFVILGACSDSPDTPDTPDTPETPGVAATLVRDGDAVGQRFA